MFSEMRAALSITKATDILDHVYSLPPDKQTAAMKSIRDIEARAMLQQEAQPGLAELVEYLEARGVRMGLCTRNFECVNFRLVWRLLHSGGFIFRSGYASCGEYN